MAGWKAGCGQDWPPSSIYKPRCSTV